MRILLIFIAIMGVGYSTPETITEAHMEDKFIWNVQLSGYDHSEADPKGETTLEEFIKELDSFPWMEQIDKAAEMPDKCSPTLTVQDLKSKTNFWISMAGTSTTEHGYILGYIYPKTKKGFFGFGKEKQINWLEMRASQDKVQVMKCVNYFFERNFESLEQTLKQMDDFGQMEAKDLTGL